MSDYLKILARLPLVLPPVGVASSPISPDNPAELAPVATLAEAPNVDDLVFAHVMAASSLANTVFTPPAGQGFVSVASGYDLTGADTRAQVYVKTWGTGDVDSLVVPFASSTGNARVVLSVIRRGVNSLTAAAAVGSGQIASPVLVAGSVSAPANALLLRLYGCAANAVNITPVPGVAETTLYSGAAYGWTSGTDGAMAASQAPRPPGPTDSGTALASVGAVANGWTTITIALEGAVATPIVQTVSAVSANVGSANATNTIAGGAPNAGDIIIAHLVNSGAGLVATPPPGEGWADARTVGSATGTDSGSSAWWKRWGAGFADNATVTFTSTGGNLRLTLLRVSGCVAVGNPFPPAGVTAQSDDAANDSGVRAPALVLPSRSLVMRFYATSATGIELTPPDVARYGGNLYSFDAGANGAMAASADLQISSAPIQSAQANTLTTSGWVGISVAVPFVTTF